MSVSKPYKSQAKYSHYWEDMYVHDSMQDAIDWILSIGGGNCDIKRVCYYPDMQDGDTFEVVALVAFFEDKPPTIYLHSDLPQIVKFQRRNSIYMPAEYA